VPLTSDRKRTDLAKLRTAPQPLKAMESVDGVGKCKLF
jgi:hypothetical protein